MRKLITINSRGKDYIDKEKGVSVDVDSWGWTEWVYVNGKKRKDLTKIEDFKACFSKYYDWSEWADKEINTSEGTPAKDSIFLYTSLTQRLLTANCFNTFTHCRSPKFAAGYLMYIVLGMLAEFLEFTDKEYEEYLKLGAGNKAITRVPVVSDLIELCRKNGCDKYDVADKITHIQRLCNSVLYVQNAEKQKEYLTYAAEKFNEYFEFAIEEAAGLNFEFRVFYGADAAKEKLNDLIRYSPSCAETMQAFEKSVWDEKDKELIQNAIDNII